MDIGKASGKEWQWDRYLDRTGGFLIVSRMYHE
jgi:hypothetical protein